MTHNHSPFTRLLLAAAVFAALATSGFAATSVTQFGITWTFDRDYPTGQFANGDYWVVGPVRITQISPRSTTANGAALHGSMVNPAVNAAQGYDSRIKGNPYSADVNAGRTLPLTLPAGSSLVSTESYPAAASGDKPQLKSLAVLTVLSAPAPAGSFRPSYFGADKAVKWNKSQLKYEALRSLAPVPGTPSLASLEAAFERPWNEQRTSWVGRYMHADQNQPTYGREIARTLAEALLSLQLNYTNAEKEKLLVRLVQYGIDVHGAAQAGARWNNDGGHNPGRKMPLLLAGVMLGDADMLAYANGAVNTIFQEDQQTWYVTSADVGRTLYTGDGRPRERYTAADVGLAEWGEKHFSDPSRDGRNWNAYYRTVAGGATLGHVLTARLMGLEAAWNWAPLFDYMDRYWQMEKGAPTGGGNAIPPFVHTMWSAYRHATPTNFTVETTATESWAGATFGAQSGTFTVSFDTVPSQAGMNGSTGLSLGAADALTDLAAELRFAPSGAIEARNSGLYQAASPLQYQPGVTYRVAMTVDMQAGRYTATVTPQGGATVRIADNYAFRSDQRGAVALDRVSYIAESGAHSVTNVSIVSSSAPASGGGTAPTAPAITDDPTTAVDGWRSATIPARAGSLTVSFDAVPGRYAMNGIVGLSLNSAREEQKLATTIRFAPTGVVDARNSGLYVAANRLPYKAGQTYRVVMKVDLVTRRYTATVTPSGGRPVIIADHYAFRSEQRSASTLDRVSFFATGGGLTIRNVRVN